MLESILVGLIFLLIIPSENKAIPKKARIESCKPISKIFTGLTIKKATVIKPTPGNIFNFLSKSPPIKHKIIKMLARIIEAEKSARQA